MGLGRFGWWPLNCSESPDQSIWNFPFLKATQIFTNLKWSCQCVAAFQQKSLIIGTYIFSGWSFPINLIFFAEWYWWRVQGFWELWNNSLYFYRKYCQGKSLMGSFSFVFIIIPTYPLPRYLLNYLLNKYMPCIRTLDHAFLRSLIYLIKMLMCKSCCILNFCHKGYYSSKEK